MIADLSSLPADKIYEWLSPPDSSRNYNAAREAYQNGTCSWFTNGVQFDKWKTTADILLWVYGNGEGFDMTYNLTNYEMACSWVRQDYFVVSPFCTQQ
jgi:hypothetical protein